MSSTRFSSTSQPQSSGSSGFGYRECSCCPYGFHIDLDFVRYCESILSQESDRTGSIKRRKDRRRQRHSMEVLLGITQPVLCTYDHNCKASDKHVKYSIDEHNEELTKKKFMYFLQNDFAAAVSDFEKVLKPIQQMPPIPCYAYAQQIKQVTNSPATTIESQINSNCAIEKTSKDFDVANVDSFGLSPVALQKIREQMALSLERTRQLEDQVKIIPQLQEKVSTLKEENIWLHSKLKSSDVAKQHSKAELKDNLASPFCKETSPIQQKDFGVMCCVLTRNIGVGSQVPNTKTVSTITNTTTDYSDKWYDKKLNFLSNQFNSVPELQKLHNHISRGTQTVVTVEKRSSAIQTVDQVAIVKPTFDTSSQTEKVVSPALQNKAISVEPDCRDAAIQNKPNLVTKGVSDDTINNILCMKCNVITTSIAVGPDLTEDSHTVPVSLAALSFNRSKSFNMGGEKLSFSKRTRSVSCQYENISIGNLAKFSQTEWKNCVKTTQTSNITSDKGSQHQYQTTCSGTDTKGLLVVKNVACETKKVDKHDVACEAKEASVQSLDTTPSSVFSANVEKAKDDYIKKDGGSPTPSRIPRPQMPPTTENRKFKRQDTYTVSAFPTEKNMPPYPKSPTQVHTESRWENSALHKAKSVQSVEKTIHDDYSIKGITSNMVIQTQETTLPAHSTVALSSLDNLRLNKIEPSSEMRGAMKVLKDALQKSQTKHVVNSRAVDIVRDEWFKVSSHATANPLHVEDYLDNFEEMSSNLLEYIVNMNDSSGNTAMHYAVSHGNFDVVSVLLDSKVCDINRPNKAGYTSVMLVSLAQIKSSAHVCVVKRLFHLADVNIKAKEHGQTALMLAVSHGRLDMVRMLIEAGADINIQDDDGSTALMCAAEHGHIDIVKYFLSQPDCDMTITDVDGSTALKIAMEANHRHIGVLLYAHERNLQMSQSHGSKLKKSKVGSPKPNSSPLPVARSNSSCALPDSKASK